MKHFSLVGFLLYSCFTWASHARSVEISSTVGVGNTYAVNAYVTMYSKISGFGGLERDSIMLSWGDGTTSFLYCINGPDVSGNGIPDGEHIGNDILKQVFVGLHTYAGLSVNGKYILSVREFNRMASINNIDNSVNVPLYVAHEIDLSTMAAEGNSTPVFSAPPIEYGNVGDKFISNGVGYDADGDSVSFSLIMPMQAEDIAVPGYEAAEVVCPGSSFTINAGTGEIVWANPCLQGIYVVAIQMNEYRCGYLLSTTVRDRQIIILNEQNNPPQISAVHDTILNPGDTLRFIIVVSDTLIQNVYMNLYPEAYTTNAVQFDTVSGNPASAIFTWVPDASDVQKHAHIFSVRVQDNYEVTGVAEAPLYNYSTFCVWVADTSTCLVSGIDERELEGLSLSVYPSPAQQYITVDCAEPVNKIRIYNADGRLLFNSAVTEQPQKIDIFGYMPGVYWVQVEAKGRLYTRKFVKYTD